LVCNGICLTSNSIRLFRNRFRVFGNSIRLMRDRVCLMRKGIRLFCDGICWVWEGFRLVCMGFRLGERVLNAMLYCVFLKTYR
jgi:hypothetical protein